MEILNDSVSLTTTFAAILLTFYAVKLLSGDSVQKKRYHKLRGSVFHQIFHYNRVHDYHTDLCRRFTTFRLYHPGCGYVYTADPANVEYILKTNFANYGKGKYNYDNMSDLLGDGIFAVDGDKWRHQRKLASHEFSTKVLRDFSSAVFKSNAVKLVGIISDLASSNQAMDIQDLFMRSTLDSIFKVGFGVELDSLSGLNEEGRRFAKAFDESSELILRHYIDFTWKIKRFFNIGSEAKLRKNVQVLDDLVYRVIQQKRESMSKQEYNSVKKEDILSRFLIESEKDPENISDKYLRDIILNFTIAGRDTTAGTLSWFFYILCLHPNIQEKVAAEVKEATSATGDTPIADFAEGLTEKVLDKMQYLLATITETLRLYPAVPEDPKICFSDDTLPDGFTVKKGDMLCYLPYSMGRMKFIWGEDAEVFRPERWFNENGIFRPENPFKFTAFQAGPRICLGKDFAHRQIKIFAAILVHYFTFNLSDENKPVEARTTMTLPINHGLHLQASKRHRQKINLVSAA
ncbi:hypothetical protein QJS10_CPB20g01579 [Acorus calamus]|uniref:Cytochrome P450 704C1-like n=1 Tax=Acorus calamus TaxID=4465 RepID=A0AAV9CCQ1_ACOCL|nr:hypothetical protein QJS10_CPB20g01579 [Acorus calamus]